MATNSIRDSQRQKIYDAEDAVFDKGRYEAGFGTVAEVQAYVDHVVDSEAWRALGFSYLPLFEHRQITVKDGRGRRRGGANSFTNTIKVPRWSRMDYYVLHELAHIATEYIHDFYYNEEDEEDGGGWPGTTDPKTGSVMLTHNVAAHGPEYAGIYLYLVREFLGEEAHNKLAAAFEEYKVKVSPASLAKPVTDADTEPAPVTDNDTQDRHCLWCGMVLASVSGRSKFCSDECRFRYHNRLRHERTEADRHKVCVVCGKAFTAKRSHAKTCSDRCRQRLRRALA